MIWRICKLEFVLAMSAGAKLYSIQYSLCGNIRGLVGVALQSDVTVSTRSRKSRGLGVWSGDTSSWILRALVFTSRFKATISGLPCSYAFGSHGNMSAPCAPSPGSLHVVSHACHMHDMFCYLTYTACWS